MDGENNGKPYEQMDDLGGKNPLFLEGHPFSSGHPIMGREGILQLLHFWEKEVFEKVGQLAA